MIVFLYGKNSYLRTQRVSILRDGFYTKYDQQQLSAATIHGTQFDIDEFRKNTKSAGLFTQKRFIVLTDIWDIPKEEQEILQEELRSIPEDTIVCITAEEPPRKDNVLFKQLLRADLVEQYSDLSHAELRAFIIRECKKRHAAIDSEAIQQLITLFSNDLWALSTHINTVTHYTSSITVDDISLFASKQLTENIFQFTDALARKELSTASRLLEEQFAQGANEQYLITMIARQFSTLLKIKHTGGKGLSLPSFIIEKSIQQASRFTGKQLLSFYWSLLHIDQKIKTRATNGRALLQQFVVTVCQ